MSVHVLVVEDDPDILSSIAEVIRDEGFEVHTAANGYQALTQVESRRFDLIFLDLMMPQMNGWKFIEELRTRFPNAQPPIVLVSAAPNLAIEAGKLGVARYLLKPFDLDDVARLTHEFCESPTDRPRHPPNRHVQS